MAPRQLTIRNRNVSEFSVESVLPDASVGRGAGGQTEATLKSGTNQFHGQLWTYFQNGAWNANSWYVVHESDYFRLLSA
jgi:hypothetical protein